MSEKNIRQMYEAIARIVSKREGVKVTVTNIKKNDEAA